MIFFNEGHLSEGQMNILSGYNIKRDLLHTFHTLYSLAVCFEITAFALFITLWTIIFKSMLPLYSLVITDYKIECH